MNFAKRKYQKWDVKNRQKTCNVFRQNQDCIFGGDGRRPIWARYNSTKV